MFAKNIIGLLQSSVRYKNMSKVAQAGVEIHTLKHIVAIHELVTKVLYVYNVDKTVKVPS